MERSRPIPFIRVNIWAIRAIHTVAAPPGIIFPFIVFLTEGMGWANRTKFEKTEDRADDIGPSVIDSDDPDLIINFSTKHVLDYRSFYPFNLQVDPFIHRFQTIRWVLVL